MVFRFWGFVVLVYKKEWTQSCDNREEYPTYCLLVTSFSVNESGQLSLVSHCSRGSDGRCLGHCSLYIVNK